MSITFCNPFMAFTSEEVLADASCRRVSEEFHVRTDEVRAAVHAAWEELGMPQDAICRKKARKLFSTMKETGRRGIVLAGRPYHIDPEINHGIPDMINSYGIAVLTEDSVSHLATARASAPCQ